MAVIKKIRNSTQFWILWGYCFHCPSPVRFMHLMSLLTDQHTQVIQMLAILSLFGASVSPDCSSSCRCCRLDVWSRGRRAYCPTNVCRRYTRTHYRYRYRSALWSCVARNSFGVTSRVPSPRAQMSARRRIRDATMQPCRLIVDKFLIADTRSKACQRPIANCTTHQTPAEMNDPQLTVRPAKIYIINWVWNFFFISGLQCQTHLNFRNEI